MSFPTEWTEHNLTRSYLFKVTIMKIILLCYKGLLFPLFSSVQSLSCVRLFAAPWIAARQASLSITNSRSSLRLRSIESVMPSSHLILCRPLLLLPPIPPSIRVFSNESTLCMRWPKYWSLSFSNISSKEHPGLISFRMDWLDLLSVQRTLKSLLQHHSSKASILQRSAFFKSCQIIIFILAFNSSPSCHHCSLSAISMSLVFIIECLILYTMVQTRFYE